MARHGKLAGCAFADFSDENIAVQAREKINQVVLGRKKLVATQARASHAAEEDVDRVSSRPPAPAETDPNQTTTPHPQFSAVPPPPNPGIAPALGLNYPFSPLLQYKYPKATKPIVENIANAMMVVPQFYTQVLHLMNKMNMPTPFELEAIKGPFSTSGIESSSQQPTAAEQVVEVEEEDEDADREFEETVPYQVSLKRKAAVAASSEKKPAFFQNRKRVVSSVALAPPPNAFTYAESSTPSLAARPSVISEQELERRRVVDPSEYKVLQQKYTRGCPTRELYVKNIAKTLDESDLKYIFGLVFASDEEMEQRLQIKLFREGRMRGQAFVTFPTVELATRALEYTHAVVMDGKPLVVAFKKTT